MYLSSRARASRAAKKARPAAPPRPPPLDSLAARLGPSHGRPRGAPARRACSNRSREWTGSGRRGEEARARERVSSERRARRSRHPRTWLPASPSAGNKAAAVMSASFDPPRSGSIGLSSLGERGLVRSQPIPCGFCSLSSVRASPCSTSADTCKDRRQLERRRAGLAVADRIMANDGSAADPASAAALSSNDASPGTGAHAKDRRAPL